MADPTALGAAVAAAVVAVTAMLASRRPSSFYASDVYGFTSARHRRVALVAAAAAVGLPFWPVAWPSIVPAAAIALGAVLYFASFARGFADDE